MIRYSYIILRQKRAVLADPALPPEFKMALAKSLRNDLFFQVVAMTRASYNNIFDRGINLFQYASVFKCL